MEISIQYNAEDVFITMSGKLDTQASLQIEPQIEEIEATTLPLIIDCTDLNFISSSGLRLLLRLRKATAAKGLSITLLHVDANIMEVLGVTHFDKMFNIK